MDSNKPQESTPPAAPRMSVNLTFEQAVFITNATSFAVVVTQMNQELASDCFPHVVAAVADMGRDAFYDLQKQLTAIGKALDPDADITIVNGGEALSSAPTDTVPPITAAFASSLNKVVA